MKKELTLKISLIVKVLCLSILLVIFYFCFFDDVLDKYSKELTNIAQIEEFVDKEEFPTFTICTELDTDILKE